MRKQTHKVELTSEERQTLETLIRNRSFSRVAAGLDPGVPHSCRLGICVADIKVRTLQQPKSWN